MISIDIGSSWSVQYLVYRYKIYLKLGISFAWSYGCLGHLKTKSMDCRILETNATVVSWLISQATSMILGVNRQRRPTKINFLFGPPALPLSNFVYFEDPKYNINIYTCS